MADAAPTVLVANRGEIALRVLRTLRRLGFPSVAVYSDADATAPHVHAADQAIRLGGTRLADSYLNGEAVIAAARASGATLIHPGYGFLAENADFARACSDAGLVFVGPPPAAIAAMGDKIRAKATVAAAGVPLLPGFTEKPDHPLPDAELTRRAERVGYPLLLKPAAGGGGKGMRLVRDPAELPPAAAAARREAAAAFGDATLLAERYLDNPRHIEVQVLADQHGSVVHLGERECSLQRRHQKIVEEAPSPLLTPEQRAAVGDAAVAAARACGYVGAGTVELIVAGPPSAGSAPANGHTEEGLAGEPLFSSEAHSPTAPPPEPSRLWTETDRPDLSYAFLEMNTRLQVEHPVTEAVVTVAGRRGVDLVELQLRVALGEPLPFDQSDIGLDGHAVECRVYAEDPAHDFLPTGGPVLLLDEPSDPADAAPTSALRVDSGIAEGERVGSTFDPLLAKVITWGPDRAAALDRMDAALASYTLLGCTTNVAFLRRLLCHPEVTAGRLGTTLTERIRAELTAGAGTPVEVYAAAALDRQFSLEPDPATAARFDIPDGWRIGEPAWTTWRLRAGDQAPVVVRVRRSASTIPTHPPTYLVADADAVPVTASVAREDGGRILVVGDSDRTVRYARAVDGADLWLGRDGAAWRLHEETRLPPLRTTAAGGESTVRSPMPGSVLAVAVEPGQRVAAGDTVAVVEAMKMEHRVTAPADGVVDHVAVHAGQAVGLDAVLAVIAPPDQAPATATAEPDTREPV